MITNPSTSPVTTFSQIAVGAACRIPVGNGIDAIKTGDATIRAINLATGAVVTVADTDVVTPAPNARYTMWP